jgi:hypothetical protein
VISLIAAPSLAWAIVVTNTNNGGPGSLRQAILDARANAGADVITFDPAVFPATINLTSVLPTLNSPGDTIDGAGQVNLNGAGIKVDGNGVACNLQCHGIRIFAGGITINGLKIQNFRGNGIRVQPDPQNPSGPSGRLPES